MKRYSKESWIDPRIEIRASPLSGTGMFATIPIKEGEVVIRWGGEVFTDEKKKKGFVKKHTGSMIAEALWLGSPVGAPDMPDQFMNHSCDPNLWMTDEVTLAARRDIKADEEITADYAMWLDVDWAMESQCVCGSTVCRHQITGRDWRLKALQLRYKDHFVPFINEKIRWLA